ncbi:MAG: restriction endonuclease subunit S [Thermoguttaceae bacterium]|nr:restriction endonuclease subunit S [Thermoguttaceae bacterium]
MAEKIRLKYLCSSFSTPITQDEIKNSGKYPVFGASGLVGYKDEYACAQPYLGIIKDGAGVGRVALYEGESSLLGTMAYILPNEKADIAWLKYALMGLDLANGISSTTIPHLYFKDYSNRLVLNLPIETQRHIAAFLDAKCALIDDIIGKTSASIEEYKKLKQSMITQAVTKGIRPHRPTKDSGIEGIGEVAEGFEVKKLKYLCHILDQYRSPITADQRNQDAEVLYDYYGASGAIDKIDGYTIDDHVMLIGEDGANLRMRNLPLMYEVNGKAWINNHAHILKPREGVDFYYLFYALEALDLNTYITGSAQPKLSQDNLRKIWVPVPSLPEQREISAYLREKCGAIDALIDQKTRLITELGAYKKSLIYEYVTGKKEVPAA